MLCIALAAFALQRGATLPWTHTPFPDGGRLEVTPVGVTHRNDSGVIVRDCRWWPRHGDASLCAPRPGGEEALGRLRSVYPMLSVALWVAVGALFVQVLRIPRSAIVRAMITWVVAALSLASIVAFATSVRPALAAIGDMPVNAMRVGLWLAAAATVLAVASGWLHLARAWRGTGGG